MAKRFLEFYPTPRTVIDDLLAILPDLQDDSIFEPCCGDGVVVEALKDKGYNNIESNDIDPRRESDSHFDAIGPANWKKDYDYVITNPPFSQGMDILKLAYHHCRKAVIFLLRLSFLEPVEARGNWLRVHQRKLNIVIPNKRPSYTGDNKTDTVTSAWMIWSKSEKPLLEPQVIYL